MFEIVQLLRQAEHFVRLGFGEVELEGVILVRRLAVLGLSILRELHLEISRTLPGKDWNRTAGTIAGEKNVREKQNQGPLHTDSRLCQPAPGGFARSVADGHCQGVAGIFRFDGLRQPQQLPYHQLHLALFGPAIPHHADLDFERRVFRKFQPSLGDGQQRHPLT